MPRILHQLLPHASHYGDPVVHLISICLSDQGLKTSKTFVDLRPAQWRDIPWVVLWRPPQLTTSDHNVYIVHMIHMCTRCTLLFSWGTKPGRRRARSLGTSWYVGRLPVLQAARICQALQAMPMPSYKIYKYLHVQSVNVSWPFVSGPCAQSVKRRSSTRRCGNTGHTL